ncbi:hypothetical protein GCM10027570_35180 [Streptomonospora sediminis]
MFAVFAAPLRRELDDRLDVAGFGRPDIGPLVRFHRPPRVVVPGVLRCGVSAVPAAPRATKRRLPRGF